MSEDKSEEEVKQIKERVSAAAKFLISKFKNLQFFSGESNDPDGGMIYAEYLDDGSPIMYVMLDGVMVEKCWSLPS